MKYSSLKLAISMLLLVFIIVNILWYFPWIIHYWYPEVHVMNLEEGVVYVIVSDIHLWRSTYEVKFIGNLCRSLNASTLIITGDLIDQRMKFTTVDDLVDLYERVIDTLGTHHINRIVHVVAATWHDIELSNSVMRLNVGGVEVLLIEGILILRHVRGKVYILHGDYICRHGAIAHVINRLFNDLMVEKVGRRVLGLECSDWLIMGHTHIPGIDEESKVANCGNWLNEDVLREMLGLKPSMTAIVLKLNKKLNVELYKLIDNEWYTISTRRTKG